MPPKGLKSIAIPQELLERLKARRRPHQAIAGVIEELLVKVEAFSSDLQEDTAKAKYQPRI